MCAINGCTGRDEALIQKMSAATLHRGPDGSDSFFDDHVSLGFNRLAIIDLSREAMQPMQDASDRFVIIFNGEIYNFKELKKELGEYPFKTQSDSEVILAAYSRWGDAAFSKLNGMFALAVWDREEKRLVLARDPVGVKPLYYFFDGVRLIFSSEIKAILEAGMQRRLNREAFGHYLRLMYVPEPMTMFEGIFKLPPGHTLSYKNSTLHVQPFRGLWPNPAVPRSYKEATEALRNTIETATKRQLVGDRPLGLYLSGGIDSSVLLATAAKVHPHINTYSVGFDLETGEEREKFNTDSALAKKTAKHFGATHHEFLLSSANALHLFKDAVYQLDEPIGNATALAQLSLARQVKETATVVLTGDGGDELFGGYERYRFALIAEKYARFIPDFLLHFSPQLERAGLRGVLRFAQLMFQKDTEVKRVLSSAVSLPDTQKIFESDFSGGDIVTELMRVDEKNWLVEEALMRSDKMSMAASVEARVPLLDLEVRSLAHLLPRTYTVSSTSTKRILKDAFRDVLLPDVLNAPKRGWFSPGAKWIRRPDFVAFADDVFGDSYGGEVTLLLNMKEIRAMWHEHRKKKGYHYTILWALLVFLVWAKEYKITLS